MFVHYNTFHHYYSVTGLRTNAAPSLSKEDRLSIGCIVFILLVGHSCSGQDHVFADSDLIYRLRMIDPDQLTNESYQTCSLDLKIFKNFIFY